jgi:hypothetical protein
VEPVRLKTHIFNSNKVFAYLRSALGSSDFHRKLADRLASCNKEALGQ